MSRTSLAVEGVLSSGRSEALLADLGIEVWPLDEDAAEPLESTHSDADGGFSMSVPLADQGEVNGGVVRLELRVLEGDHVIQAEIHEFAPDQGPYPIEIRIPGAAPNRSQGALPVEREIGSRSEYELLEDLLNDQPDVEPETAGTTPDEDSSDPEEDIYIEAEKLALLERARELEAQTSVPAKVFYALGHRGLPLELHALVDVSLSELRGTVEAAVEDEIIDATSLQGVDDHLKSLCRIVREQVLQANRTSIDAGLGDILACADVPREALGRVLERYQARDADVADFWESLRDESAAHEVFDEGLLSELETAVGLAGVVGADPPLVRRVLDLRKEGRWQELEDLADLEFDDWCELLESLEAQAADDDIDLRAAIDQGGDSSRRHETQWTGERYTDDEDDEPDGGRVIDEDDEDDEQDWIEARAEAILDSLEETFPSAFIRREVLRGEELGEGARRVLERTRKLDFLNESIRARTARDAELLEGLDPTQAESALEEIEAIERVSRVTERAHEVAALLGSGITSAHAIAAHPRRHFVDAYAETLGGRPQASRVHAQAQQVAGAGTLAMVRLLQALQQTPFVLSGGGVLAQAARDRTLKDMPDTRTLFGNIGLCSCEHCRSVYSPAAYFVDLLRYLDLPPSDGIKKPRSNTQDRPAADLQIRKPSPHRPLDVLLARRPDIADIALTCENTLTPLPYIDLVNELLEARVTGRSAAHDTGRTPADVLAAVPQHVDRDAYERLRHAVHPVTLPFHEPLAVARAYLGHLGVQRRKLLKVLGRGEGRDDALVAEALEMSPEEFDIVSKPPGQLWRHFGFEDEQVNAVPYTQTLAHAPTFLAAIGISFQELIDLASTRFVNGDSQLLLESPSADCDPEQARIAGLDEGRLSKMVRLVRLRRRLGVSLMDLDRALFALRAADLDTAILQKLVDAQDVSKQLDTPIAELLVLWAPIDTFGDNSQFERLLRTRAVAWRTPDADTFKLRDDRLELAHTGENLDAVAPALLAAFRLTSEELSLARAIHARLAGKEPRLDLDGLSAVYRVALLARVLKLRMTQLDGLLRLVPPDANPFRAADPGATRRFVDIVHEVRASAFTPEQLAYLYDPVASSHRDPGPTEGNVQSVLATIRQGLIEAFVETTPPALPTPDFLRQKLGMWLDSGLVDPAMETLDPRTRLSAERRRQFFKRHLAGMFSDAEVTAQFLFAGSPPDPGAPPPGTRGQRPQASEAPAQPVPAPTATSAPPDSTAEQKWRSNIERVVENLLPRLRAKLMRGAVVKVLSETLATTSSSIGRLLDGGVRSRRRAGRPLIDDFFALVGTGLTGHYFANRDLQGEPASIRTDAKLEFSWAGAVPAPGLDGAGFSIRWTGRLLPKVKARHTFFVTTDGGVRLSMTIDGTEHVLLDEAGTSAGNKEHVSKDIALDPAKLYEIKIEYRSKGAAPSFAVQHGTSPDSLQPIASVNLFPVDALSTFDPVALSYRRLHKAALLLTGFGISEQQLEWLSGEPPYLDFDKLPMEPSESGGSSVLFQRWRQFAALYALRKRLPPSATDLFACFTVATLPEATTTLVKATGWAPAVVEAFLGDKGFAVDRSALSVPADPSKQPFLLRLEQAVDLHRRTGVSPETLFAWAAVAPDADLAAVIVQAVKARYDEKRWLEVAEGLNGPLRMQRREALVGYLLPRLREQGVVNRSQLFEYLLIDVEMNPCMQTSRIKQAISAVQTFYQRCLMNLESQVSPRHIDENDWKWLKSYRLWEANRKIFLYPENWIEPELRDDKSPEFKALERTILQQEIKKENVESAFIDYLQNVDEISRLDVRAVWFERRGTKGPALSRTQTNRAPLPGAQWDEGTYHIFARTYNAPHKWYYRRLERGRTWMAWEKIDADIEGDHLVPAIFQNRMHLFWAVFREKSKPVPEMQKDAAPLKLGKDWEIALAYSVHDRGRWTRKQLSSGSVVDSLALVFMAEFHARLARKEKADQPRMEGSAWLPMSAYTLQAALASGSDTLAIHVYRCAVDHAKAMVAVDPRPANVLSPTAQEFIASFELLGCNGELSPMFLGSDARVGIGPRAARPRKRRQPRRLPAPTRVPLSHRGLAGRRPVPPGYRIDGNGFSAAGRGGPVLSMATSSGGTAAVLQRSRSDPRGTRIVPVFDPSSAFVAGLFPFFFQDPLRSYFARPVSVWTGPRTLNFVRATPPAAKGSARSNVPHFGRRRGGIAGARSRRESIELTQSALALDAELGFEALDADPVRDLDVEAVDDWDAQEDEAWHPDDAVSQRAPRRRSQPARAAPPAQAPSRSPPAARMTRTPPTAATPIRALGKARIQGPWAQRLRFVPFEHPQTCRLISTLKSEGIEQLLELGTSRPSNIVSRAQDHVMKEGKWLPLPTTDFERRYQPGPLTDGRFPRLDIDFGDDNPYALYNWELFFHAPLQVAVRLAKDGRHEEAQRWFHFIFDPTSDTRAPPPRRYWRFAPFHENTDYDGARESMALLSYAGEHPELQARKRRVMDQVHAWWERPFSPHVIARLRLSAYQKAVVMKYIDNLIDWGDKLFRRDTLESIQEATQLYILAGNILGPKPDRVPSMVENPPVTFRAVRAKLDLFANWAVRFENSQVRRPFRVNASPDAGGTTSILGMATLYFCVPTNPELDKKWDMVADRLFKIRNCMNITGVVRRLPLFEPPIDPAMLVRAAAAGVDLSSVIASLNAPPPIHRFRFLVRRAIGLAEQLRSFGAAALSALERRDSEQLAALRQLNEKSLLEAIREVHKSKIKQVEEELASLAVQRDYVDMQMRHVVAQAQQLMNPQESAKQQSLTEAQAIAGVAEGIDLVSKVMYAIPDFQTGAAGAFSSPFVTLQLGGKMFGDIAAAVAESMFKVMNKFETQADMQGAQAEYQRRQAELIHQGELLAKERERVQKQIGEVQFKLELGNAELKRHETAVENAAKVAEYLRTKYTSDELYGWMIGQLSTVHFQAYKFAFDSAKLAERALQFERGESSLNYIEFSYWDSLKKGLLSGDRLWIDLRRMESAYLEDDRRLLEVVRNVSLKDDAPAAFEQLLATGRCEIEVGEALLDGDFPGHYFRRLKTVSMSMSASAKASVNVNCTLTLLDNRIRISANASGSYPQSQDGDDARFLMNIAPVQAIATSRASADAGVFDLKFDDDRYLPFEGAGAISTWRIELHQADNAIDLAELANVEVVLAYSAKSGGTPLEMVARASREAALSRGVLQPPPQRRVSLRHDLPEAWKQLQAAKPEQSVKVELPLAGAWLPARLSGANVRIESAVIYARGRSPLASNALLLQISPPGGEAVSVAAWMRPWSSSRALRASADVKGPPGAWSLALGAKAAKVPDILEDLVLVFDLRAQWVS